MNEQEWTDQWVAKLNRLGAEMDRIAASMHPSGWADALAPHWQRYRALAEQHYKPTKPIALQFQLSLLEDTMPPMAMYKVGELFSPGKTQWAETVEYNFRGGQHVLRIFFEDPTEAELEAFKHGGLEFAIYPTDQVIFFCFKMNGLWSDGPFNIHLVPENERQLPEALGSPDARDLLTIFYINAANGILMAIKAVTFSPAFTAALRAMIRRQHERSFSRLSYDTQVSVVYAKYTSEKIATKLAIDSCKGGEA